MKNGWFLDSMGHKLVGFGLHLTHRCVLFSSFRIGGKKKERKEFPAFTDCESSGKMVFLASLGNYFVWGLWGWIITCLFGQNQWGACGWTSCGPAGLHPSVVVLTCPLGLGVSHPSPESHFVPRLLYFSLGIRQRRDMLDWGEKNVEGLLRTYL